MDTGRALLVALMAAVALGGLSLDAFAEEAAISPPGRSPVSGSTARAVSAVSAVSDWLWPLAPRPDVVAGFDPPTDPYGPGHVGVDLLGWPGQPVTSVATGTVVFAGQVAGIPVVSVQHGSERSTYQPVVAGLARGDTVEGGQVIGTLSTAGSHCLPLTCLHLGRRLGRTYLDPLELLGGGAVRLLPRHGEPLMHSPSGAWTAPEPAVVPLLLAPAPGVGQTFERLAARGVRLAARGARQGLRLA